ncbi:hypothetical protein ASPACDRAFT_38476 [Aspergillus aculeatus ATCC 16872]|uniref:Uncharacterized protein n=1 Tax=Aspergillus aculeatus (strain ATCC 16872 / CBS 172.66 / WB 5094) TaxID=690307 RepID=A0A1L9X981_ASPA1|nr:uncharacterized protein ASPACDRAFT_38476 [Aspergillus aculeatus ATCC 16872]OJK04914.1 hypothetical protein ASPACDRAFT_38476 [Aspergillus aculeatus ATCC 16872]
MLRKVFALRSCQNSQRHLMYVAYNGCRLFASLIQLRLLRRKFLSTGGNLSSLVAGEIVFSSRVWRTFWLFIVRQGLGAGFLPSEGGIPRVTTRGDFAAKLGMLPQEWPQDHSLAGIVVFDGAASQHFPWTSNSLAAKSVAVNETASSDANFILTMTEKKTVNGDRTAGVATFSAQLDLD